MPSAQGLALLEQHAAEQGKLSRLTAAQMLQLWPLLVDRKKVDANTPGWLRATIALIERNRLQSAALTARYMTAYRMAELGRDGAADTFVPDPIASLDIAQITTSLMVTGPQMYRKEVARHLGVDPGQMTPETVERVSLPPGAVTKIAAGNARAAMRHVRNGGRETTDNALTKDKRVVGQVRVIRSANPCFFCAMLASRGPVYEGDSFDDSDPRFNGPGQHKVHDGCSCELVPLYKRDNDPSLLNGIRQYEAEYVKARELAREERIPVLLAFRRLHEGR